MREPIEGERGLRRCADYGQDELRALTPIMGAAQFGGSIVGKRLTGVKSATTRRSSSYFCDCSDRTSPQKASPYLAS